MCVCVLLQEEFCFPVECLSLTVEEVMHIRQVLVKAELEKFQQYKDIYHAMKKGKVTSSPIKLYKTLRRLALGMSSTYVLLKLREIISGSILGYIIYFNSNIIFVFFFLAALFLLSNQTVFFFHLVLHLPVLQKVKHLKSLS